MLCKNEIFYYTGDVNFLLHAGKNMSSEFHAVIMYFTYNRLIMMMWGGGGGGGGRRAAARARLPAPPPRAPHRFFNYYHAAAGCGGNCKKMSSQELGTKVYVGDLGSGGSKPELEREFERYGTLKSVWVARNPPGKLFSF